MDGPPADKLDWKVLVNKINQLKSETEGQTLFNWPWVEFLDPKKKKNQLIHKTLKTGSHTLHTQILQLLELWSQKKKERQQVKPCWLKASCLTLK